MYSMEDTQVARTIELNDGTRMPALGLGTWKSSFFPRTSIQGAVETAIAAGYRHIDTAYSYKNEVDIGKALQSKMQQGIIRRQDMFIVSKLWCTYHAPEDIPVCLNKSLNDLQLDYLDLYLVHFPVGLKVERNIQNIFSPALTPGREKMIDPSVTFLACKVCLRKTLPQQ